MSHRGWVLLSAGLLLACGGDDGAQGGPDAGQPDGGGGGGITEKQLPLPDGPRMVHPRFSPDGSKIAFLHTVSTTDSVAVMNADGTGAVLLTGGASYLTGFDWSADGAEIFYSGLTIRRIPAAGGDSSEVVGGFDAFASFDPDLSPDGTTLVFATNGSVLRLVDLTQTPPVVTDLTVRGWSPRFSPDGQTIAYADGETEMIRLLDKNGTNGRDVVASGGWASSVDWFSDGQRLVATTDQGVEIVTLNTSPLQRRKIRSGSVAVLAIDLSPDDKTLAFSINGELPLRVMTGF